ncbi:hypothetical protein [Cetobacterium sp.]|uniref:hypothetical protein n=1 Tax=Cetobacterium sp. TaxID=2071632 RepID=UPI003EE5B4EE
MIIFENIKGHELSWAKDAIMGVRKVRVFGTSRTNYLVVHENDVSVEISEQCFKDFKEAGYQEI